MVRSRKVRFNESKVWQNTLLWHEYERYIIRGSRGHGAATNSLKTDVAYAELLMWTWNNVQEVNTGSVKRDICLVA